MALGLSFKPKKPGDKITAKEWNAVVRAAKRTISGAGVIADMDNVVILSGRGGGGGGGSLSGGFAKIVSRGGVEPPYRYTCSSVVMDVDGAWTASTDPVTYQNCFNLEEQGHGGQWVAPLIEDDVVMIFPAPTDGETIDAWVIARAHYRGTY